METKKILLMLALAAVCGCAKETAELGGEQGTPASKVINTPENADAESILVYLEQGAAGTSAVDSISKAAGALSCEPLFESFPGREAEERRFGLDRWYELKFSKGTSLESVVSVLSAQKKVQKVQYNTRMQNVISCRKPRSYRPQVMTKSVAASGSSFNDPMLQSQWNYKNDGNGKPVWNSVAGADINVTDAWKLTGGDPSIIVAVVDEGVAYSHPDLKDNMWKNPSPTANDLYGYNFVTNTGRITWTAAEDSGHGTHVAGTIAAVNNNGVGVCGIAGGTGSGDGVRIMSCQIFSGDKGGESSIIAKAAKYAADHGASILQCSFGMNGGDVTSDNAYLKYDSGASAEIDAYRYFVGSSRNNPINGGVAIFAAGNETYAMAGYPGAMTDLIAVTAIGCDHRPASYTNYGPGCNIAAPGGDSFSACTNRNYLDRYTEESSILSTMPLELKDDYMYDGSGYGYMEGTSMACPHVSGVAALALSYMKKLGKTCSVDEFKSMLLTSVDDEDQYCTGMTYYTDNYGRVYHASYTGYKGKMGTGSIDAWKLLMQIEGTPCSTVAVGDAQQVSMEPYFGGSYASLKYTGVEISADDMAAIGISTKPEIVNGVMTLNPTKSGNVKITVKAVAGGNKVGTGTSMGGMEISKTISVLARGVKSSNGGWL